MRLLVVEDDERVARALGAVLTRHGYETTHAGDGHAAIKAVEAGTDMVLLDLGLPDIDGMSVCTSIRRRSSVPIIMVTARSRLAERIQGLRVGADDYVVKPYDGRELIARIEAISRRSRVFGEGGPAPAVVVAGDLRIDLGTRVVTMGGEVAPLTKMEFDLLGLLARHPGVVVPRERILREVWGTGWKGLGRSLEVHVASIRRKLGSKRVIETARGVGYRLVS